MKYFEGSSYSHKFLAICSFIVIGGFCSMSFILTTATIVYYVLRDGHFDPRNGYMPYKVSLPFEIDSIFTWLSHLFFCLSTGSTYALINVTMLAYLMALAKYFEACRSHFGHIINAMDTIRDKKTCYNNFKITNLLMDAINLQVDTKR